MRSPTPIDFEAIAFSNSRFFSLWISGTEFLLEMTLHPGRSLRVWTFLPLRDTVETPSAYFTWPSLRIWSRSWNQTVWFFTHTRRAPWTMLPFLPCTVDVFFSSVPLTGGILLLSERGRSGLTKRLTRLFQFLTQKKLENLNKFVLIFF